MKEYLKSITGNTKISLSLAIAAGGGLIWLIELHGTVAATAAQADKVAARQVKQSKVERRIDQRLSRLEVKFGLPPLPPEVDTGEDE